MKYLQKRLDDIILNSKRHCFPPQISDKAGKPTHGIPVYHHVKGPLSRVQKPPRTHNKPPQLKSDLSKVTGHTVTPQRPPAFLHIVSHKDGYWTCCSDHVVMPINTEFLRCAPTTSRILHINYTSAKNQSWETNNFFYKNYIHNGEIFRCKSNKVYAKYAC